MLPALLFVSSLAAGRDEADAPVIATVGATRITEAEKDDLGGRVLGLLLENYAAERKITVTDEEVGKLLARLAQGETEERARIAGLEAELRSDQLAAEDRKRKADELASLRSLPDASGEEGLSEDEKKELAGLRDRMARALIRAWKINRALFDQYGGRVVYQQGGPEPLDAYRKFLEERMNAGAFKLADPKYETNLWRIYTHNELHDFVPDDRRSALIHTPPWERKESGE